jgi:hypothetical protein
MGGRVVLVRRSVLLLLFLRFLNGRCVAIDGEFRAVSVTIVAAVQHNRLRVLVADGLHVVKIASTKILELLRIIDLLELVVAAGSLAQPSEELLHEQDEHEPTQRQEINKREPLSSTKKEKKKKKKHTVLISRNQGSKASAWVMERYIGVGFEVLSVKKKENAIGAEVSITKGRRCLDIHITRSIQPGATPLSSPLHSLYSASTRECASTYAASGRMCRKPKPRNMPPPESRAARHTASGEE